MPIDPTPPPRLAWLDRLATTLGERGDVVAVLSLGSTGMQLDRFDDFSDLDFFVIVDDLGVKRSFLDDIGWLESTGDIAFSFVNDQNGRKALLHDGTLLEYAVFTPDELRAIPFADARVVWRRADATRRPGPVVAIIAARRAVGCGGRSRRSADEPVGRTATRAARRAPQRVPVHSGVRHQPDPGTAARQRCRAGAPRRPVRADSSRRGSPRR